MNDTDLHGEVLNHFKKVDFQIWHHVKHPVQVKAWDQLETQVGIRLWSQIRNQVWMRVWNKVGIHIRNQHNHRA